MDIGQLTPILRKALRNVRELHESTNFSTSIGELVVEEFLKIYSQPERESISKEVPAGPLPCLVLEQRLSCCDRKLRIKPLYIAYLNFHDSDGDEIANRHYHVHQGSRADLFLRFLTAQTFPKTFTMQELLNGMRLERNPWNLATLQGPMLALQDRLGLKILPSKKTRHAIYRFNIRAVEWLL